MIKQAVFLFLTGLLILYGLVFTLKHFGWPSDTERKNKFIRAIRTGFSSTSLGVGLLLRYFYWTSPEEFWAQWAGAKAIWACILVVPILGILTATAYIQFSVWERTQSVMTKRLRTVISESTKDSKKVE